MIAGPAWFAAAWPVSTKMPAPITAPTPSSTRWRAVSVRLRVASPSRLPSTGSPASTCGAGSTGLTLISVCSIRDFSPNWWFRGTAFPWPCRDGWRIAPQPPYLAKGHPLRTSRSAARAGDNPTLPPRRRRPRSMTPEQIAALQADLLAHADACPDERAEAELFVELLRDGGHGFLRERLEGHFTASSWLVSADGRRALLTHHRKLDRWLQPGGHADGDPDLARVALTEAT